MNKDRYIDLYFLLWKEYKIQIGRSNDRSGYRYAKEGMLVPEAEEIRRRIAVLYDLLYRKGVWLNIFAQEESKVVYNGRDFNANGEKSYEKYLNKGVVYTLKKITPYEEMAIVELAEFPGIKFEASSFFYLESRGKSEEELLEEYGPGLQEDLKRIDEIIEEIDKLPKPTVIEELQEYYEDVKKINCCDALDDMITYLTPEECKSEFNVGDSFYDGGRNITILYISDENDNSGNPIYFCQIDEDNKGLTWYFKFDQCDMEVIKIAYENIDENALSEKQRLIRKIMLATRGVMWSNANFAPEVQLPPESARAHKYNIGDIIENGTIKIVYVSPKIDCDNNWTYLYRENYLDSDGKQGVKYYIMQESGE